MEKTKAIAKAIGKLGIRRTIAVSLTLLFIYLSIKGSVDAVQVTTIYGMIIGFYFGRSTALDVPSQNIKNSEE